MVWMFFLGSVHNLLGFPLGFSWISSQSAWVRLAKYTAIQSFVWVTFLIECACYLDLLVSENTSLSWDLSHKGLGSCFHLFPVHATQTIYTNVHNYMIKLEAKFLYKVQHPSQESGSHKCFVLFCFVMLYHCSLPFIHILMLRCFCHITHNTFHFWIFTRNWACTATPYPYSILIYVRQFKHNQGIDKFMTMLSKTQYVESQETSRMFSIQGRITEIKAQSRCCQVHDNSFQDTICRG
jgi:hypothetical protein